MAAFFVLSDPLGTIERNLLLFINKTLLLRYTRSGILLTYDSFIDMAKKGVWLTYDLGVGGDYKSLYSWLDDQKAIECGSNLAYFKYDWNCSEDKDSVNKLLEDLQSRVEIKPGNRLYLIRPRKKTDSDIISTIGSFIYGKRMASPWEGFGSNTSDETEEA